MKKKRRLQGQDVHGMLLLDKPAGISSNGALQRVKQIYQARKAGHTGSLDPLANGLLPICLGEATKLSGFLLEADKRYQVRCRLGVVTTTGDADGEVVETHPVNELDEDEVAKFLSSFSGPQEQVPPMYSAIKYQGQPLYKLARQGIEVERKSRQVTIHTIKLTGLSNDQLEFEVFCSKGTYIRTLAEAIGQALGCGAHVIALRRTQVGSFGASDMVSLEELEMLAETNTEALGNLLLPVGQILADWPAVDLIADLAYYLRQGQSVRVPQAPSEGWVRLMECDKGFFGVGRVMEDGRVAPRRLIFSQNG
ncbi:tRNA pseudouridine(55) synthase TruB [Nitrosococcus watsonii]|uniref:tRNA pseudouridine synthase B n=1 Tax=Nitrosococcus watsoni (strain C-113) TaxID=105559 RepID=D8K4T6_NITWC|nr:tRNA pseudouridine(55) synthase TruB [Nitrosococcus watsonii]ADJ27913.1 tRNA pseudouridine synthase B [Nitrosococcus watsonii C-113]